MDTGGGAGEGWIFNDARKRRNRQLARCRFADWTSLADVSATVVDAGRSSLKDISSGSRRSVDADPPSVTDGDGDEKTDKNFSKINYDGHWTGSTPLFIHIFVS
jgi:hypothetical protein